jgi:hypothetical protein
MGIEDPLPTTTFDELCKDEGKIHGQVTCVTSHVGARTGVHVPITVVALLWERGSLQRLKKTRCVKGGRGRRHQVCCRLEVAGVKGLSGRRSALDTRTRRRLEVVGVEGLSGVVAVAVGVGAVDVQQRDGGSLGQARQLQCLFGDVELVPCLHKSWERRQRRRAGSIW